jgi:hypothetical protein
MACLLALSAAVWVAGVHKAYLTEIVSCDPIWDLNCYSSKDNLELLNVYVVSESPFLICCRMHTK